MLDTALHAPRRPSARREILAIVRDRELPPARSPIGSTATCPAISSTWPCCARRALDGAARGHATPVSGAAAGSSASFREWLERFWDDGLGRLRQAAEEEADGRIDGDG